MPSHAAQTKRRGNCNICRGGVSLEKVVTLVVPQGTWIYMCRNCDGRPH